MKILITYTGGTIGMMPSALGLAPSRDFVPFLETLLQDAMPQHDVDILSYERLIDSSNVTPRDWCRIGLDIDQRWDQYDAFIILHGTDTMAYTAAALHTLFQHRHKPIIVTGSQVPFSQTPSDAEGNLLGSIKAATYPFYGVYLYFDGLLIDGDRAHKSHTKEWRAFSSINHPVRAELTEQGNWHQTVQPAPALLKPINTPKTIDESAVTLLPVYPGVTADHWQGLLGESVKGAILLSYGAGNIPDQNIELIDTIQAAIARGVTIINVSQCSNGCVDSSTYAAGSALIKAGVISGKDMTYEAAFAKLSLMIGVGLVSDEIKRRW